MSHTVLTYHLVFSTYRRQSVIDEQHERELYKFMFDFAQARGAKVWRIGGMTDHIHILCDLPPTVALSSFVKVLKGETSKFMKANPHFPYWEGWSESFGGFTVDAFSRQGCIDYIMHQKEHHRRHSFAEEYRTILRNAGFDDSCPILGDLVEAK